MEDIDVILQKGSMQGLRDAIQGDINQICLRTFENYMKGDTYTSLGEKIATAHHHLCRMTLCLNTLNKLDGESK